MNKKGGNKGRGGPEGPTSVGAVLKEILAHKPIIQHINRERSIWDIWDKSVGKDVAKHARPKNFRNGVLFVETNHPIWNTELQFQSHTIRAKLNENLGSELVKEIHFHSARK